MENIETIKECDFLNFYNNRLYNANCFNTDGSLNENYNSFKSTGIIASIFEDHWDKTYLDNKPIIDKYRPNATVEVQKIILDILSKKLGKSFDRVKSFLYRKYPKGFYVYAEPKKFKDLQSGIEYVTRYCGRVPISENRIINYDGSNVTFSYIDHKDNKYHQVTLPASQFIMILLQHLLPTQFKIIRYYGFYRKKYPIHSKMIPLIKHHCRNFRKQLLKYQLSISIAFHRNPYHCPKCDTKMIFVLCII